MYPIGPNAGWTNLLQTERVSVSIGKTKYTRVTKCVDLYLNAQSSWLVRSKKLKYRRWSLFTSQALKALRALFQPIPIYQGSETTTLSISSSFFEANHHYAHFRVIDSSRGMLLRQCRSTTPGLSIDHILIVQVWVNFSEGRTTGYHEGQRGKSPFWIVRYTTA